MKTPNSNLQAPEKLQTPSSIKLREQFVSWGLMFGASLELGGWNLELIYG
jgi:hypothetical protein